MTHQQEQYLKWVRDHNMAVLRHGLPNDKFLKTWFAQPDGVYYDAVGDELFICKRVGGTDAQPQYAINFGDEIKCGAMADHGFNEFLECLTDEMWTIIQLKQRGQK